MTRWTRLSGLTPPVTPLPRSYLASLASCSLGFAAFGLCSCVLATMACAAPVTLAWDAVEDARVAGYQLYYGAASGQYSIHVDVGHVTSASLSGLDQHPVYYLAVTAYDTSGQESGFSNEVTYDLSQIDTDGDGLKDWDELSVYQTDPTRADTDGDGLSDGQEVLQYRTDPRHADTDGDGVNDGTEVTQGTNPKEASSGLPQNLPEIPRWQMAVVSVDSEEVKPAPGPMAVRPMPSTGTTPPSGRPHGRPPRPSLRMRS